MPTSHNKTFDLAHTVPYFIFAEISDMSPNTYSTKTDTLIGEHVPLLEIKQGTLLFCLPADVMATLNIRRCSEGSGYKY